MRRLAVSALCILALSGCAANTAKRAYVASVAALNACLIANPSDPAACQAQRAVMNNDLMLYSNLSQ
jgi:hypothetical protein